MGHRASQDPPPVALRTGPSTYLEYVKAWDDSLGQILTILQELDDLELSDRTIVVFTSDHGEMAGTHGGMHGKGRTPLNGRELPDIKGILKRDTS